MCGVDGVVEAWSVDDRQSQLDSALFDLHVPLLHLNRLLDALCSRAIHSVVKKGSPYSITERTVLKLIPVLGGSQPAGDVNHKPGGRLPLLSARSAITPATFKRAATNFAAW